MPKEHERSSVPGAPQYLLLPEAAEVARAPVKTLRAWIADGRLQAYRSARRVLVRLDDLIGFLEGRPQPSREGA